MTNTTVPTGWTPDVSPNPATLPQLRALLNQLQGMTECAKRNDAIYALDNAIDCLVGYRKWLEFVDEVSNTADDAADLLATTEAARGTLW